MLRIGLPVKDLNVIRVAIIGVLQLVFSELDVNLKVPLGTDGPDTIHRTVVGQTVIDAVRADVGRAYKVLEASRLEGTFANVGSGIPHGIRNECVHSFEARIGNRLVAGKTEPKRTTRACDDWREFVTAEFACKSSNQIESNSGMIKASKAERGKLSLSLSIYGGKLGLLIWSEGLLDLSELVCVCSINTDQHPIRTNFAKGLVLQLLLL